MNASEPVIFSTRELRIARAVARTIGVSDVVLQRESDGCLNIRCGPRHVYLETPERGGFVVEYSAPGGGGRQRWPWTPDERTALLNLDAELAANLIEGGPAA